MRAEDRFQRAGRVLLAAFVAAALLGAFGGGGPLATATASAGRPSSALEVEYQRFTRRQRPVTLRVQIDAAPAEFELWLDREYLRSARIETIHPEPVAAVNDRERWRWRFESERPGERAVVVFALRHEEAGAPSGRVGVVAGPELAFSQWVYP